MTIAVISTPVSASGSSPITTGAYDTTGATLLAVAVSYNGTTAPTITDSKSNSWTAGTKQSQSTTFSVQWFYCLDPTSVGSSHTFTATLSSGKLAIYAVALSGTLRAPWSYIGGQGGTSHTSVTQQVCSSATLTPSTVDCIVLSAAAMGASISSYTAGTNFTAIGNVDYTANNYGIGVVYQYQDMLAAGITNSTATATWTNSVNVAEASLFFVSAPKTLYANSGGPNEYAKNTAYTSGSPGSLVVLNASDAGTNYVYARRWVWECTTSGTTDASAYPTWPAYIVQDTTTITSGTAVFTARRPGYSSGTTHNWSYATKYLEYSRGGWLLGDTIKVASTHSETVANWNLTSNSALQITLISVNTATEAYAPGAALNGRTGYDFDIGGACRYYGFTFTPLEDSTFIRIEASGNFFNYHYFYGCQFIVKTGQISFSYVTLGYIKFENCTFKFTTHASRPCFAFVQFPGFVQMEGCSHVVGTGTRTFLVQGIQSVNTNFSTFSAKGCDFSAMMASGAYITNYCIQAVLADCKLPSSWVGKSTSTSILGFDSLLLTNCDSSSTNYRIYYQQSGGSLSQETTLIRTSGANDGTTGISWKIISTYATSYLQSPFRSPEIVAWVDTTGSAKTATVEILCDTATALKDNEVWLEVMYLGSSASPLGTWKANDTAANNSGDFLATAAAQTTSSATWTTTGMSNPTTQKLSVSFTPQMKGYVVARVCVAKPSATIYVDPVLTIA